MSDHTTSAPDTAIIAGMVGIERLRRENARLRKAWRDAVKALRATDALLDPLLMEHRNRIEDNAPIIAALQEDRDG